MMSYMVPCIKKAANTRQVNIKTTAFLCKQITDDGYTLQYQLTNCYRATWQ